ncbi:MAG: hypothetical protein ACOYMM_13810 [Phycisphaerales bacterium]|jgi:hypothetical protein
MKSETLSGMRRGAGAGSGGGAIPGPILSRIPGPILVAAVVLFGAAGCEQEPVDEPRGGGYVAESPKKAESGAATTEGEPAAKSTLGKAKQAAEKVINEDVAEYNRKLEQAADDVYKKGK